MYYQRQQNLMQGPGPIRAFGDSGNPNREAQHQMDMMSY